MKRYPLKGRASCLICRAEHPPTLTPRERSPYGHLGEPPPQLSSHFCSAMWLSGLSDAHLRYRELCWAAWFYAHQAPRPLKMEALAQCLSSLSV